MAIECLNCQTSQFLQILESRLSYNAESSNLESVSEEYQCTNCGARGGLISDAYGKPDLFGDVYESDEQPRGSRIEA